MDQYVSWCLPTEDLSLEVIWAKYEDFCMPQTKEVRASFDMLKSFRLDTCADVNIMPVSVYKLVFQHPDCTKFVPSSKLEIGTYTTDKIKVVGSCVLYVVHLDTQCLQEVTFYLTSHEGSVVLSCVTTLALGMIQPHPRLDYLPPRARLITSSADHPKKTKSQISVHVSKKESEVSNHKGMYPSSLQARTKFLPSIQMFLMVLDAFLVPHTIFRSIPREPIVDQSLYISKILSRRRLTRSYKWEF